MRRSILLRIAAVALAAATLTACEIGDWLDLFDLVNLSDSSDPYERAAGDAADEAAAARRADAAVDNALGTKNPNDVDEAISERPDDPRYKLYKTGLLIANGQDIGDTARDARRNHRSSHPNATAQEEARLYNELVLDTLNTTLTALVPPESVEYERVHEYYCSAYRAYLANYQNTAEGQLYLQFANTRGCAASLD